MGSCPRLIKNELPPASQWRFQTLSEEGVRFFVACLAGFSSFCDYYYIFLLKIRGGGAGAGPLGPPPLNPPLLANFFFHCSRL